MQIHKHKDIAFTDEYIGRAKPSSTVPAAIVLLILSGVAIGFIIGFGDHVVNLLMDMWVRG
jgi:hypothetical protein